MKNIFDRFKRHSKAGKSPAPDMQRLFQSIAMIEEEELSCDDVFAILD
jgi:hypothetical protein